MPLPTDPANLQRGREAEAQAYAYLCAQGLTPLAQNYRTRTGEIDLIMKEREVLVFVEVRFRARADFGGAAETIDIAKQRRVRSAAEGFLQAHPAYARCACRFDVVALDRGRIEWLRDAFQ